MLRIARDLLDQQIIDVNGRKVVRVNDVTMGIQHDGARDTLSVLEVDIGIRSIFRRLFQGVLPPLWIRRLQRAIPPNSISLGVRQHRRARPAAPPAPQHFQHASSKRCTPPTWPISSRNWAPPSARRSSKPSTAKWPPTRSPRSDPKMQASILESLEPEKAADIVEEMSPDEAADVLSELEEETSEEILEEMDSAPKTEVRELLEFDEDTAGGMMNTEYVVAARECHRGRCA